uniref:Uncharacterized protein n=1 Tax=Acrobeloides nanus TaxID=290746 RepID=A0A914DHV9_9BILA
MQLGEIANYDQYAPQVFKADTLSNTLIMCWIYISIGAIAIFANAINIFLFLSNKELRTNYIFHILLDFGEIINGISYISMGIGIYQEARSQYLNTYITVHDCFYKLRPWGEAIAKEEGGVISAKVDLLFKASF